MKATHIIIIILIIALNFSFIKCSENANKAISANEVLQDSVSYFRNKLGTKTATITALETDKLILSDSLQKLVSEFKEPKYVVEYKTKFKIDTLYVPYDKPVDCEFSRFGRYDTKWISFNYQSTNKGNLFESFEIRNKATIITGFKKKWLLGKKKLVTDITNSNPYFQTTDIKSTVVTIPVKWHETRVANMAFGYALAKLTKL